MGVSMPLMLKSRNPIYLTCFHWCLKGCWKPNDFLHARCMLFWAQTEFAVFRVDDLLSDAIYGVLTAITVVHIVFFASWLALTSLKENMYD